jgi:hypothetical protein
VRTFHLRRQEGYKHNTSFSSLCFHNAVAQPYYFIVGESLAYFKISISLFVCLGFTSSVVGRPWLPSRFVRKMLVLFLQKSIFLFKVGNHRGVSKEQMLGGKEKSRNG